MDPQDKKSKDWSILGKAEDRAIAKAKYKREMGINPAYKTEQSAEVSRSAQSMKNPTDRPYDVKTSPVGLKKPRTAEKATVKRSGLLPQNPFSLTKKSGEKVTPAEKSRLQRFAVIGAVDKVGAGAKSSSADPVKSNISAKTNKEAPTVRKAATDKSRVAPKMTNYQRMQAKQLEKEGYAGRSLTRAQAQKMAGAKSGANTTSLMVLFGISKPKTEKKAPTKRTGPLKSAFAQISYQGRKK